MKKLLVIGDSCRDVFVYGKVDRLCPEAPVPVFIPHRQTETGGMASNVYENILSLKFNADIITNTYPVIKTRYVEEHTNHMIVRIDSEKDRIQRIEGLNLLNFNQYECVIVSDYNKGFLTYEDIEYICNSHPRVFIDTKKVINNCFLSAFCIKINSIEYNNNKLAGYNLHNHPTNLIVTLGHEGCRYKDTVYPVKKVEVKDMSGAGDTFLAGLVVSYAETKNLKKAIKYANKCATAVVQHKGVNKVGDLI